MVKLVVSQPVKPPVGLVGWVLDDDARTRRARSILYPICATVAVGVPTAVMVVVIVVTRIPTVAADLLGIMVALFGVGATGIQKIKHWHARRRQATHASDTATSPP